MAGELAAVLEQLLTLQVRLHAQMREKLSAMRRADSDAILAAAHGEGRIAAEVEAQEARRQEIVGRMCGALSLPFANKGRNVSLRALAERLDANLSAVLLRIAQRLREAMLRVAETNRVVELVSREMLEHFKAVFRAMVADEDDASTYRVGGGPRKAVEAQVLDAMG